MYINAYSDWFKKIYFSDLYKMPGRDRKKRELDRKRKAERRLEEGPEARQRRLETNATRQEQLRRNESQDEYRRRLQANAERNAQQRRNESQDEYIRRLEANAERNAQQRRNESQERRHTRLRTNRTRIALQRGIESQDEHQTRLAAMRELNKKRLEKALKEKANIANYDDVQYYQEGNHQNSIHRLQITSIFQCPKCSNCEAYLWPEERKSFCCNRNSKKIINLKYPQPGSIPPQPPTEIKELFTIPQFMDNIRKYNNALAFASIGIKEIRAKGEIK